MSDIFTDEFIRESESAVPEELHLAANALTDCLKHLHCARVHALALELAGRWGINRNDVGKCSDEISDAIGDISNFGARHLKNVIRDVGNDNYLAGGE